MGNIVDVEFAFVLENAGVSWHDSALRIRLNNGLCLLKSMLRSHKSETRQDTSLKL